MTNEASVVGAVKGVLNPLASLRIQPRSWFFEGLGCQLFGSLKPVDCASTE